MTDDVIECNGIDGNTGRYLGLEPLVELANRLAPDAQLPLLKAIIAARGPHYGTVFGGEFGDLSTNGWAVVQRRPTSAEEAARNADVRAQLAPLLELRKAQAGTLYREIAIEPGETRVQFFARIRHPAGPIDPRVMPYYLLIAAEPDEIDFAFQCSLDVCGAVGRICFDDLSAYGDYARRVVAAETTWVRPRTISFLGVNNDRATLLSSEKLVAPLYDRFENHPAKWQRERMLGEEVERAEIVARLGGAKTPGIVFVATHGMEFRGERQRERQGSLLCQEWSGDVPRPEELITADDIAGDTTGLVCFLFACYGLGTPQSSDFQHLRGDARLAARPFVSRLAQRLVELGALAVIGHVERAWGYGFELDGVLQLTQFESALHGIMTGARFGAALEGFGQRYADLATRLASELEMRADRVPDPRHLVALWTAVNDARGYALFGDPAAHVAAP